MKADVVTEAALKTVLDNLAAGYASRDMAAMQALFAPDPDLVMYGTGADEKRVGLAEVQKQIQRDWSQADSTTVTFGWTSISAAGSVAWAAADVAFKLGAGGRMFTLPARLTVVFEKRGEKWLIVQAHFSFPAAGQAEGESFPTS